MTNIERDARKEQLTKEVRETRDLIKALTQSMSPLLAELNNIDDEEILEASENWIESREKINMILDKGWNNGMGNAIASALITEHIKSIKPEGVAFWSISGHYDIPGQEVRVVSVFLGLDKKSSNETLARVAEAIEDLRVSVGSTSEHFYLPIMDDNSNASYELYPATNEVKHSSWGAYSTEYKGETLVDALDYIRKNLSYGDSYYDED